MDCSILTVCLSCVAAPRSSASPPAPLLPDVHSLAPSPGERMHSKKQRVPRASTCSAGARGSCGYASGLRPLCSVLVSCHTTSTMDLRAVLCTPSLHPYSCRGFLLPLCFTSVLHLTGSASALEYSGSAFDDSRPGIAWVSSTSDVAYFHRLSFCACGSIGRPPVVVSLDTTLASPSLCGLSPLGSSGSVPLDCLHQQHLGLVVLASPSLYLIVLILTSLCHILALLRNLCPIPPLVFMLLWCKVVPCH